MFDRNILDVEKILKPDELEKAKALLEILHDYARDVEVPFFHADKGTFGVHPLTQGLWHVDLSYMLDSCDPLPIEVIALIAVITRRADTKSVDIHSGKFDSSLWRKFITPVLDSGKGLTSLDLQDYGDTVKQLSMLEGLLSVIYNIVERKDIGLSESDDKQRTTVLNSFFSKTVSATGKHFIPQPGEEREANCFYQSLKYYRNRVAHGGTPGDVQRFYTEPANDSDFKPKLVYYHKLHLSTALFAIDIVRRYFHKIAAALCTPDDYLAPQRQTADEYVPAAKQWCNAGYIARAHRQAADFLQRELAGVKIDVRRPDTQLPQVTLTDSTGYSDTIDEMIDGDTDVFVIAGPSGSGKTMLMMQMIHSDTPRLMPFYFNLDGQLFDSADQLMALALNQVCGIHPTSDPKLHQAVLQRLRHYFKEGLAVFFLDGVDFADKRHMSLLRQLIHRYPDCTFVIGTLKAPDCQHLASAGIDAKVLSIDALSDDFVYRFLRLASISMSGADHSSMLAQRIKGFDGGEEALKHPATLVLLTEALEGKDTVVQGAINPTKLAGLIYQHIAGDPDLDEEDRQHALSRPFLTRFRQEHEAIDRLIGDVTAALAGGGAADAFSALAASGLVSDDESRRRLFRHLEVYPDSNKGAATLRTLAAMAVVYGDFATGMAGFAAAHSAQPLGAVDGLETLATAIEGIALYNPGPEDFNPSNPNLLYRPRPRFILQSFINNLMDLYAADPRYHGESTPQMRRVMLLAARCGTPSAMDRLFQPFWMRRWLVDPEERMPGNELPGLCSDDIAQDIITCCSDKATLVYRLRLQCHWMEIAGMQRSGKNAAAMIQRLLSELMTDESRYRLITILASHGHRQMANDIARLGNTAILSMNVPLAYDRYDTDCAPTFPVSDPLGFLIAKGGNRYAIGLKLKVLRQLAKVSTRKHQLMALARDLVERGVGSGSSPADREFREILLLLAGTGPKWPCLILDLFEPDKIDRQVAERVYDMRVFGYTVSKTRDYEEHLLKRAPLKHPLKREEMLLPVCINSYRKNESVKPRSPYTFYSQTDSKSVRLYSECLDEQVEGCWVRAEDCDGWWRVADVTHLKEERGVTTVAELLVFLDARDTRKIRHSGRIGIRNSYFADGVTFPYIHAFTKEGSPLVVLRVDDPAFTTLLSDPSIRKALYKESSITVSGLEARIVSIDVRPLPEGATTVTLKPFLINGSGPKTANLPHRGFLTFYFKAADKDSSYFNPKVDNPYTRASHPSFFLMLGGDFLDDNRYMFLTSAILSPQQIIRSEQTGRVYIIEETYPFSSKAVPAVLRAVADRAVAIAAKAGRFQSEKERNAFNRIVVIRPVDDKDRLDPKSRLFPTNGFIFNRDTFRILYHNPVVDPRPKGWDIEPDLSVTITMVPVRPVRINHRGKETLMLSLPDTAYPKDLRFYATDDNPDRYEVEWITADEDPQGHYLRVPQQMRIYWEEYIDSGEEGNLLFYDSQDAGSPVAVTMDNIIPLITTDTPYRYHASVIPLICDNALRHGKLSKRLADIMVRHNRMDKLAELLPLLSVENIREIGVTCGFVLKRLDDGEYLTFIPHFINDRNDNGEYDFNEYKAGLKTVSADRNLPEGSYFICTTDLKAFQAVSREYMEGLRRLMPSVFWSGTVFKRNKYLHIKVDSMSWAFSYDRASSPGYFNEGDKVTFFPSWNPNSDRGYPEARDVRKTTTS